MAAASLLSPAADELAEEDGATAEAEAEAFLAP